jgi:Mor family transcriptional regulator
VSEIAATSAEVLAYLEDIALDAMSKCGVPAKEAQRSAARLRRAIAARFGGGYIYLPLTGRKPRGAAASYSADFEPFVRSAILGVLAEQGVDVKAREPIVLAQCTKIVDHFRGAPIYISLDSGARRAERVTAVRAEFNGSNHFELAAKHGVCLQTIYKDLSRGRKPAAIKAAAKKRHA